MGAEVIEFERESTCFSSDGPKPFRTRTSQLRSKSERPRAASVGNHVVSVPDRA
jgi:hypothetical protein